MPTTLTLTGVPDEVYERLKASAGEHRRSLSNEAIVCLETALRPRKMRPGERLARVKVLRASLLSRRFSPKDIDRLKRS